MPKVIASRSIAKDPFSAALPLTKAQALADRGEDPQRLGRRAARRLGRHRRDGDDHRQARDGVDGVGGGDAEGGDHEAGRRPAR